VTHETTPMPAILFNSIRTVLSLSLTQLVHARM
jgi:hypothetical protein